MTAERSPDTHDEAFRLAERYKDIDDTSSLQGLSMGGVVKTLSIALWAQRPSIAAPDYERGFSDGLHRAANMAECANPKDGRDHTECPFCTTAREIREQATSAPSHVAASSVDIERVKAWFYSKPRKRAEAAFTAGDERQLAYMLEDASEGILAQSATEPSKCRCPVGYSPRCPVHGTLDGTAKDDRMLGGSE